MPGTPTNLRIGDLAPDFKTESQFGEFSFYNYLGDSWGLLFSHPKDFTPVCTTELGRAAQLKQAWEERDVKIAAISVDTAESHREWIKDINEINDTEVTYPIIADASREVSLAYAMLDQTHLDDQSGLPLTVRSVFFIDPSKHIKAIITYPASTGRNFDEILRVVDSLQMTATRKLATPADWKTGDTAVILPSVNNDEANVSFPGFKTVRPWLRTTDKY